MSKNHISSRPANPAQPFRWFPVKNTAGSTAPPNSLMLITGMDANGVLQVTQPTATSMDPRQIVISNGSAIAAGSYGEATMDVPWWVANGDGGSIAAVAAGSEGGTQAGSWVLGAGTGFFALAADSPTATALVMSGGGGGGGGGMEWIRITGTFVTDISSGLCYYPGVIAKLALAGWSDTSTLVNVVFWYAYASVPPILPSTDPTVVIVDGTAAVSGKSAGYSYSGRPVYGSTDFAALWSIQCQIVVVDGTPIAVPKGVIGG